MEKRLKEAGTGRTARNRPRRQLRSPRRPATKQVGAQATRKAKEGRELDASTGPYRTGRASKVPIQTESAWDTDGTMPMQSWRRNGLLYSIILYR